MKLSIIIPVYNCESYVSKCLNSLVEQKISDMEIIVINDGSTDESLSIIKSYAKEYNFIKVIEQKNAGQGSARNQGLKICKGEYVTFVDSDDFVSGNDSYTILYNECKKNNLDMLIYNYNVISNERLQNQNLIFETDKIFSKEEILEKFFTTNEVEGFACNKLFKREILIRNNIKFLESKKFEDIPMVMNCILTSERIMFNNVKIYNYVMHENSTTNNVKLSTLLDEIDSMQIIIDLVLKEYKHLNTKLFVSEYVNNRISIYITYRIRNLFRRKLIYSEFKFIMRRYCKMIYDFNRGYGLIQTNTSFKNRLKIKIIKLVYSR